MPPRPRKLVSAVENHRVIDGHVIPRVATQPVIAPKSAQIAPVIAISLPWARSI